LASEIARIHKGKGTPREKGLDPMRDDQMIKKWTCKIERAVAMLTLKLYLIKHMIIQSVMIRILTSEAWLKKKLLQSLLVLPMISSSAA